MNFWIILLTVSVCFLLLEMFTPTLFFINLAIAAAICALLSFLGYSYTVLVFAFLIISIITIGFVRPLLLKKMQGKAHQTGMEDKYIGKSAKVVQEISQTSGRVAIYGEEWQAHLPEEQTEPIPVGELVKIISNDSIVFIVEKIKEN